MFAAHQLDVASVLWFFIAWVGYTVFADHSPQRHRKLSAAMDRYRLRWMVAMLGREIRVVDTSIVGNILTGVAFFASTTIFVIGGLVATLGAGATALSAVQRLPFASATSMTLFELKVLLLVAIFIYAFFKFAWAFRVYNNCSVLIGAAPHAPTSPEVIQGYSEMVGRLLGLGTRHFNLGMRAYFFAMAAFSWVLNPTVFMVATTVVVLVVYRREFRSRTVAAVSAREHLAAGLPASAGPAPSKDSAGSS
jgi:uncharacterized membrane protein